MDAQLQELRVSNDARNDPEELQRRMAEDGYLFFKQLQNPDKLWALRREMLTVMQVGGWLLADTDPMDGIADVSRRCTEGDEGYTDVYHEVQKIEAFHRAAHEPEVLDMVTQIVGRPVMPHPQKIARLWFPKYTEHTTPTHQDFVHFQGSFETFTCWSPVGDCPIELGGLAILPGSHKVNRVIDHHFSLGAGSLNINPDELDGQWHTTNYEVGDSLIFPALTIHKALPNVTEDRLRVSLDNRYHGIGDPVAEHMLLPHLSNGGTLINWDEIYRDWESDDLKYYWRNYDMSVVARDMSYSDRAFEEAVELAKKGDERAQLHLRRVIHKDPTTPQAQTAQKILNEVQAKSDPA